MSVKPKFLNSRGDTIVEVLVVLAVLGLAIAIAYATANRSLLNARQALENSTGTQIAQAQMEDVVSMGCASGNPYCPDPSLPASPNHLLFQPGSHCIDTSTTPYTVRTNPTPTVFSSGGYDTACITGRVPYYVSITYRDTATQPHTFVVVVTWADALGQGNDTVTMNYRLEP